MAENLRPQDERDLKETIRATLRRRSHRRPSEGTVQDIYELVIIYSAQIRYRKIQEVVEKWAQHMYEMERR